MLLPFAVYFVIPTSIGKDPVPELKLTSYAPVDKGYPELKTIPPPNKFPFISGVAVNPQLSAVEPVKVEKVKLGSIINF